MKTSQDPQDDGRDIWFAGSDASEGVAYFDLLSGKNSNLIKAQSKRSMASAPSAPRTIQVCAGELHSIATLGEQALVAAGAPFYIRGGLVRPVIADIPAAQGRRAKVARLLPVSPASMIDHLSRVANWQKWKATTEELVPTDPPRLVADMIISRDGEWTFRPLTGVITTQTLRPDGTILSGPGYDPATQLLLLDPPALPSVPDKPTRSDALNALRTLDALLDEFPFVDDASRAVALSALITPVVRGALLVAPLHATTAPVAGSGKSYIIDLATSIATGQRAPVISAGREEAETEKRLHAALLAGQPIVSIDNVNGILGGDALCQAVERPVVHVRPLGVSKLVQIESRATIYATGNNIQLLGDMTRRVVLCSLDPQMERPEIRTFNSDPFEAVLASRGKYIAAALTLVRAYIVAGCPDVLPALASFGDWSRLVRSPLVWLGYADPCETMERARAEDPTTTSLRAVLAAWYFDVSTAAMTTGKIIKRATEGDGTLKQALLNVASGRHGEIDGHRLGLWLGKHKGRIVDELRIVASDDGHTKQKVWSVVRV